VVKLRTIGMYQTARRAEKQSSLTVTNPEMIQSELRMFDMVLTHVFVKAEGTLTKKQ